MKKFLFALFIVGTLVLSGFISSAIDNMGNKTEKGKSQTTTPGPTATPTPTPTPHQQEETKTQKNEEDIVKTRKDILDMYIKALDSSGMNQFLASVRYRYASTDECSIVISVRDSWHYQHKQLRLQAAQNLWKLWAKAYYLEENKDKCRMDLVDLNGNNVGGSSWLGGSVINVTD